MRPWTVALIAILAGIGIAILLLQSKSTIAEELQLPLLAVIAIVIVLAALAFISTIFQHANLTDTKHALGLPEGSIRALIALSLIVVFTVITLFVLVRFSRMDATCQELLQRVQAQQSNDGKPPVTAVTGATATTATTATTGTTSTTATTGTTTTTGTSGGTSTQRPAGTLSQQPQSMTTNVAPAPQPAATDPIVAAVVKRMESAHDLAKQLLTMLGTLLAAISSFYFGASATASASDPSKLREMAKAVDQARRGE